MIEVKIRQRGKKRIWQAWAPLPGNQQFRQSLGTTDEDEALQKAREIERQLNAGVRPDPSMTVEAWLKRWMQDLRREGRRANTLRSYERICRKIIPRIGAVKLGELTVADVQRMDAELMERGGHNGRRLDAVTVKQMHDMLAASLHEAERQNLVVRNVASLARRPKQPHREPAFLERQDLLRLFECAPHHEWGPFFAVTVLTGLRNGEACGLRWNDVDLQNGTLHVQRQRALDESGTTGDAPPKSQSGVRRIPLSPEAVQWLERIRLQQRKKADLSLMPLSPYVFARTVKGQWQPYNPPHAAAGIKSLYASAGLEAPKRPVHALRHTTGTLLAEAQADAKIRAALLGHSDIAMTMRYTHLSRTSGRSAMAAVGEAVREPKA